MHGKYLFLFKNNTKRKVCAFSFVYPLFYTLLFPFVFRSIITQNKHLKLIDRTAAESAGGGIERRWRKAGLE